MMKISIPALLKTRGCFLGKVSLQSGCSIKYSHCLKRKIQKINYKYKNYFYFLTNHCLTRYMCCKWVYISFITRYLHPSLHLIFFSFLFYKILIAVCDASFQQQLNKNIGAANFLKSSSLFASHFHFYSFYYILIAVCVCV